MGRRSDEDEEEALPADVAASLEAVRVAFRHIGYPNAGLAALGELALVEYGAAKRGLDRRGWHGQLMAVARVCGDGATAAVEVEASDVDADFG